MTDSQDSPRNFRDLLASRYRKSESINTVVSPSPIGIPQETYHASSGTGQEIWQSLLQKHPDKIQVIADEVARLNQADAPLIQELASRWMDDLRRIQEEQQAALRKRLEPNRDETILPPINRTHEVACFAKGIHTHLTQRKCPSLVLVTGWHDEGLVHLVKRLCYNDELKAEDTPTPVISRGEPLTPKKYGIAGGEWSADDIRSDIERALKQKWPTELDVCYRNIIEERGFSAVLLTLDSTVLKNSRHLDLLVDVCEKLGDRAGNKLVVFYCMKYVRRKKAWWSLQSWLARRNEPVEDQVRSWIREKKAAGVPPHVIILEELDDVTKLDVCSAGEDLPFDEHPLPDKMPYDEALEIIRKLQKLKMETSRG